MGNIVTFYSYKGGVGRSMALANVGVLLAQRGLDVLMVDWDLEAPGLERFFHYFPIVEPARGLLAMLVDAQASESKDWPDPDSYCSKIECEVTGKLALLASGREQDLDYSTKLEQFNWEHFFSKRSGGEFLEKVRDHWRRNYDIVLIDSRTGLSDAGGVCTIQMPDIVVALFTATAQSVYGVRDVMRLAQLARQRLPYERMRLSVVPVPSRWATHEFREGQLWIDRIAEAMYEFVVDWLPAPLIARDYIESLKIPQHEYFSYGEKLAVVEQGVTDPTGMGYFYRRIASFLASNMQDIVGLVGADTVERANERPNSVDERSDSVHAEFDILISHDGRQVERALEFSEALRSVVALYLGRQPRVFIDFAEVRRGTELPPVVARAIQRTRTLIALVTPTYLESPTARQVAEAVVAGRQRSTSLRQRTGIFHPRVYPVWIQGTDRDLERVLGSTPDAIDIFKDDREITDLRSINAGFRSGMSATWMPEVSQLGETIALYLRHDNVKTKEVSEHAPSIWSG